MLSDPAKDDKAILVVNWTSWEAYKEQTCVLEAGDHARNKKRSCVYYIGAEIRRLTSLQLAEAATDITVEQGPLAAAILQKIREGAAKSDNILKAGPALLRAQGFIT